jgi:dTMP kinase
LIREPGGPQISEQIRTILLDNRNDNMNPITELLLYESARAQLIDEIIRPVLNRKEMILSDRFTDSTLAYQGYGRSISLSMIRKIHDLVCGEIHPDRTYFLDISWEVSLERRSQISSGNDRMEKEQKDFFNRVRNGYLEIADNEPDRVCILDGTKSVSELEQKIFQDVMILLKKVHNKDLQ